MSRSHPHQTGSRRARLRSILASHEAVLLFVLIGELIFFNWAGAGFGTTENISYIARHSAEIGLLALVMTPIILTGGIDLSVGSLLGLCAVVFGKLWRDGGLPPSLAAVCTICVGAFAGALNGGIITTLRLPPLIVTLGTYSLFRGIAEAMTRGVDTFTNFPSGFLFLGQSSWIGVPVQAWIFFAVALLMWLLVHRTTFGRSLRAIGYAPEGARYAGIPVQRRVAAVYVLAGAISAIAAVIYTARLGQAKADAGTGYELFAITAVVLGGTSIFGGVGSIHGTLLGIAAIAVLGSGLFHARQPREVAGILTGALLLIALMATVLPKFLSTLRLRRQTASDSEAA